MGWRVAAELFATTLDVYLTLGLIREDATDCDTANGRPATRAFARARLARMLGGDAETVSEEQTEQLAQRLLATGEGTPALKKEILGWIARFRNEQARTSPPPATRNVRRDRMGGPESRAAEPKVKVQPKAEPYKVAFGYGTNGSRTKDPQFGAGRPGGAATHD